MMNSSPLTVVFSGYAPVHVLCILPLYKYLRADPAVEFWFTGGTRTGHKDNYLYDSHDLYSKLGIPADRVLSVEEASARKFDVLFSASSSEIVPLANVKTSVQIFHGISMRNRGVRAGNLRYDYLLLVGPYMRRLFAKLNILAEDDPRAISIGFPKTDRLLNSSLNRDDTLRDYGFDGSRPVLLYAPTGTEHNSMELFGSELIAMINQADQFDLWVKPHDHPRNRIDQLSGLSELENAHCKLVTAIDIIPLLHAADMVITDASSVANEFTLLDRPLVFVDVPDVFSITKEKGAFVDYDARNTGVVVKDIKDIVAAIASELANPEIRSAERQQRAEDLFYNPGNATDAVATWFYNKFLGRSAPSLLP